MRRTSAEREPPARMSKGDFARMESAAVAALRRHGFEVERSDGGVVILGPGYSCSVRTAVEFARDAGIRIEP